MFLMTSDPQNCHLGVYTQFSDTSKNHTLGDNMSCVYIYIQYIISMSHMKEVVYPRFLCLKKSSTFSWRNPQCSSWVLHGFMVFYHPYVVTLRPSRDSRGPGAWIDASDSAKDQSLWGGSAISDASAGRGAAVGLHGDFMGNSHEFSSQFIGIYD